MQDVPRRYLLHEYLIVEVVVAFLSDLVLYAQRLNSLRRARCRPDRVSATGKGRRHAVARARRALGGSQISNLTNFSTWPAFVSFSDTVSNPDLVRAPSHGSATPLSQPGVAPVGTRARHSGAELCRLPHSKHDPLARSAQRHKSRIHTLPPR
jgi:hypothetical protein